MEYYALQYNVNLLADKEGLALLKNLKRFMGFVVASDQRASFAQAKMEK